EEKKTVTASLPDIPEWEERDKLTKEKEVLGFYLTSHPLAQHAKTLQTFCSHTSKEAAALSHRTPAMLGGMLAAIKIAHTKNPQPGKPSKYAMFDLEDTEGIMRCILWPEPYVHYGELVQPDALLVVLGKIDKRPGSEDANFIVDELIPLDEVEARYTRGMMIRLSEQTHGVRGLEQLYEILRGYPGNCELKLLVGLNDGRRVQMDCEGVRVELNSEMRTRVDELLGSGNVRLIPAPHPKSNGNGNGHGKGNGYARRSQGA
ncbi:MAG: OB-fold nucleic acid binding domain-containing protein, partial [Thermoguttaceae bacterium]